MSKIIAIDFGLKRTGLAISDESKIFAFGLDTIPSDKLEFAIEQLLMKEAVDTIVIGLPIHLDQSVTDVTGNVKLLADHLRNKFPTIEVELYDERFTSSLASQAIHLAGGKKKHKMEKGLVDKVSATILLQSYISSKT